MRGKFITIEGPDGAGKTTQIKKIAQYLKSSGKNVMVAREPGGTAFGEKLREVLLSPGGESPVPEAEALVYAASRAQLVKKVIAPALSEGIHVLCDRFVDSSLAYQGWARGLGIQTILDINRWFINDFWPDITVLLDADPALTIARLDRAKDRLERETMEFHKRVREGFLKVQDMFPERIMTVDASESPEEVFNRIISSIRKIL
ncbi:MAG: dTMP kinase [Tepidanaerobacteraceae bacterium]|jgi:dTMP kinase|nr:dTMP kinase [Tepidanaerobacteraceae bacterium]